MTQPERTAVTPSGIFDRFVARETNRKRPPARIQAPRLVFIIALVVLVCIGLPMIYSASSIYGLKEFNDTAHYLNRQAVLLVVGALLCILSAAVPYHWWQGRLGRIAWLVLVLALLATAAIGAVRGGSRRWITIAGILVQPSEVAKIAFVLVGAAVWLQYKRGEVDAWSFVFNFGVFIVAPIAIILLQPDMGTAVIAFVGVAVVLWMGGAPRKWFVYMVLLGLAVMVILIAIAPYRLQRFSAAFRPEADPTGDGYQIMNSLYAYGSGGLFGVGLGNSTQKFIYLPACYTDFIFAIIGEELGFVGCLAIILIFAVFVIAGFRIARNAATEYGQLIAAGCTSLIAVQALVNIMQTIGLFPVTGKPLPFISYGGSSLFASMIMAGLVISVSIHDKVRTEADDRRDNLTVIANDGLRRRVDGSIIEEDPYDDADESNVRVTRRGRDADEHEVIDFAEARSRTSYRSRSRGGSGSEHLDDRPYDDERPRSNRRRTRGSDGRRRR